MKKIVFLDQYNTSGGAQTILVNLVRFALELNYEVEVWLPNGYYLQSQFKDEPRIHFKRIQTPTLPFRRRSFMNHVYWIFYSLLFLRHFSKLKKVDFIYVNGPRLSLAAILISLFYPAKFFYHLHLIHSPIENLIFKLAKVMPRTEYLFFASDYLRHNFDGNKRHKKSVVFNGFLSTQFSALPYVNRFNIFHSNEIRGLNIMLLARVYQGKGHDLFLKLAADFPQHNFYIIGNAADPSYYDMLRSRATTNVVFTYTDYVPTLINDLGIHVSVTPSIVAESFGLSPIESMALSCLSIVSDKGNLPYQAEKTGSWVFSDYEQLKKMIQRIEAMDHSVLHKISRDQYESTKRYYALNIAKAFFEKHVC
ncbi:MAG: glycosyltransferase family 4 protein [Bacteroidota bacterium]